MREIAYDVIEKAVAEACKSANYHLDSEVTRILKKAVEAEESETGVKVLQQIMENAEIAGRNLVPMCQDTGVAVVFLEIGQDVHVVGGNLDEAINHGVAAGYTEGFLRKSMVNHPFERKNTGDNTPAVIHAKIVPGASLKITVAPKGAGSENMAAVKMLSPAAGKNGVKEFVVEAVKIAGPNPCPPVIVGVGIGGNFEKAALLSKEALLRPLGAPSSLADIAEMEQEILTEINQLGIGPQGFGGKTTALAVHINTYPCHIASLPVAVNLNCHASRHKTILL